MLISILFGIMISFCFGIIILKDIFVLIYIIKKLLEEKPKSRKILKE